MKLLRSCNIRVRGDEYESYSRWMAEQVSYDSRNKFNIGTGENGIRVHAEGSGRLESLHSGNL